MTTQDGTVFETTEYLPFGSSRTQSGAVQSSYKFTDQELDPESGLYNYDARLYDPVIGRFITADSIVPGAFNPQTLNRYSYCYNNPLIYVDPTGHISWESAPGAKEGVNGGYGKKSSSGGGSSEGGRSSGNLLQRLWGAIKWSWNNTTTTRTATGWEMRTKGSSIVRYYGTDPDTLSSYQGHYWDKGGRGISNDSVQLDNCFQFEFDYLVDYVGQDYKGVNKPTIGDFLGSILDYRNNLYHMEMATEVMKKVRELEFEIKCGKPGFATLCFNPGPPVSDITVSRADGALLNKNSMLACFTFKITGRSGCLTFEDIVNGPRPPYAY